MRTRSGCRRSPPPSTTKASPGRPGTWTAASSTSTDRHRRGSSGRGCRRPPTRAGICTRRTTRGACSRGWRVTGAPWSTGVVSSSSRSARSTSTQRCARPASTSRAPSRSSATWTVRVRSPGASRCRSSPRTTRAGRAWVSSASTPMRPSTATSPPASRSPSMRRSSSRSTCSRASRASPGSRSWAASSSMR